MSWHSRLIIQLYILKSRLGLKMRRHKIFLLLMSVMTNALKKDTTAGKSVKSGRFPLGLSLIFTNLDSLAGLQSVVMVVRVRHLWNKTTRSRSVLFDFFTQRCSTYWSGNPKTLGKWKPGSLDSWLYFCARILAAFALSIVPVIWRCKRRLALNALNRQPTYQRSLRQKMKRTAMDNNYMIQVLSSAFLDNTLDSSHLLCQA